MEVLRSIPWNLGEYPEPFQVGEWLVDTSILPPPRIVHIHLIREGTPWGWSYFTRHDSDLIHKVEEEPRPINSRIMTWARVATKFGPKVRISNFNPPDSSTVWVVGSQGIYNLQWDPKEWRWKKIGGFP